MNKKTVGMFKGIRYEMLEVRDWKMQTLYLPYNFEGKAVILSLSKDLFRLFVVSFAVGNFEEILKIGMGISDISSRQTYLLTC